MIPLNYKPGDVIPPSGRWICECGLGHHSHETQCVDPNCTTKAGSKPVEVWGNKTIHKVDSALSLLFNRSMFKRSAQNGNLFIP